MRKKLTINNKFCHNMSRRYKHFTEENNLSKMQK